ncbi:hypothetical protein ACROYT_G032619 [Oculina patagonica]
MAANTCTFNVEGRIENAKRGKEKAGIKKQEKKDNYMMKIAIEVAVCLGSFEALRVKKARKSIIQVKDKFNQR